MKPLPFPVRLAAGLAATTVERARTMPQQLLGLPITLVSQVLQASMRVQQNVTELAIKGDDVLAALQPVEEEAPGWATFDEDLTDRPAGDLDVDIADTGVPDADVPAAGAPDVPGVETPGADVPGEYGTDIGSVTPLDAAIRNGRPREDADPALGDDPWAEEQRALSHDYADGTFDSPRESASGPAGMAGYDELSLPQLRARLRQFSLEQLDEILAYERAHANRSSFTGMLSRRIDNVRREGGSVPGQDDSER